MGKIAAVMLTLLMVAMVLACSNDELPPLAPVEDLIAAIEEAALPEADVAGAGPEAPAPYESVLQLSDLDVPVAEDEVVVAPPVIMATPVPPALLGVQLNTRRLNFNEVGQSAQVLVYKVYDNGVQTLVGGDGWTGVEFESTDVAVAAVGDGGTVSALAPGRATLWARWRGFEYAADVVVSESWVEVQPELLYVTTSLDDLAAAAGLEPLAPFPFDEIVLLGSSDTALVFNRIEVLLAEGADAVALAAELEAEVLADFGGGSYGLLLPINDVGGFQEVVLKLDADERVADYRAVIATGLAPAPISAMAEEPESG